MELLLPIKPKQIPRKEWDAFLEKSYVPYIQANMQKIVEVGISQADVDYFERILNKLYIRHEGIGNLGFWGALVGAVISAIPSTISSIAQYRLGKQTLKLQKEQIEAQKAREAREAAKQAEIQKALMEQQQVKSGMSVSERAVEAISQIPGYAYAIIGIGIIAILFLKRR